MSNNKLGKNQKLKSKRQIDSLFAHGKSLFKHPIKCMYSIGDSNDNAIPYVVPQVMVIAPKRSFKKATDRNLIKRRIREAYRLNNDALLLDAQSSGLLIAFICIDKEISTYASIDAAMKNLLSRLLVNIHTDG